MRADDLGNPALTRTRRAVGTGPSAPLRLEQVFGRTGALAFHFLVRVGATFSAAVAVDLLGEKAHG